MAYTPVDKSSLHFNTVLFTANASTQSITGVGFQPDMVWGKSRGQSYDHEIYDAVRGVYKRIKTNQNHAEVSDNANLTSFDSDGFSLGSATNMNYSNGDNICSWNWKANGAGSSNTDGDITSTVSANTTSGFSIVKYTGNGSASNIGHGLGAAPQCIIIKKYSATADWLMGHVGLHPTLPWKYGINLNNTGEVHESGSYFADTVPGTSVFRVEANDEVNTNGQTYIAYCFAEKIGFSKFGAYVGNGNAEGPMFYTGFKPGWVLIKKINGGTDSWFLNDVKRQTYNPSQQYLRPNENSAEGTSSSHQIDILSNGVKIRSTDTAYNTNGSKYIFLAFAQAPLVASNNSAVTAR
jgi:hypothetical protein